MPNRKLSAALLLAAALTAPTAIASAALTPTPVAGGMVRAVPQGESAAPTAAAPVPTATSGQAMAPAASRVAGLTPLTTPTAGLLRPVGETAGRVSTPVPSVTATPTATLEPSPTETPSPTATPIELPSFDPANDAVKGSVDGSRLLLEVPVRSQFDGTDYQSSNCGPTSLAMVLDAFGVKTKTYQLRNLVNHIEGNYRLEDGTSLDDLAWIAAQAGVRAIGLYDQSGYRRWTLEQIRDEVRHGHPVITLVKYGDLPDAAGTASQSDHYVVVVGLDGPNLLINDPAMPASSGARRPLTPAQLQQGWADSSIPRHGAAFGATDVRELDLPDPSLVYLGDGSHDDWRADLAAYPVELVVAPTPMVELVDLRPMSWPEPLAEVAPELTPKLVALAPLPLDDPNQTGKPLPAAPDVSPMPAPGDAGRGFGLLSLLSLPFFLLRTRIPY